MPGDRRRRVELWIQLALWPNLILLIMTRLLRRRRLWLLELADTGFPYLLTPIPLVAALAVWFRSCPLTVLSAAGAVLGLCWARLALGHSCRGAVERPELRVLTANVLGSNPSADGIVALIERERPDLVALQEVRPELCAQLFERVQRLLPYSRLEPHERFSGAALLSRWPLEEVDSFLLRNAGHWCQRARLTVRGRAINVYNVHLDTPFEVYPREVGLLPFGIRERIDGARDREIRQLLKLTAETEGALLLLGDFNTPAGSRAHQQLLGSLRDAFQESGSGLGLTFPRPVSIYGLRLPCVVIRIDYAFFRGPLRPLAARTLDHIGSDHLALLADFAIEPRRCLREAGTGGDDGSA